MCIHNSGAIRDTVMRNGGCDLVFFDITNWESFRFVLRGTSTSNMIQTFKMAHLMLPVVRQQL